MIPGIYIVASAIVLTVLVWMRYAETDRWRPSPDSAYYMRMADGLKVPSPYQQRILVPLVARVLGGSKVLSRVATSGNLACLLAVYAATTYVSGSPMRGLVATIAVVMADSAFGLWICLPWLVDGWAFAFGIAGVALVREFPIVAACLLLLCAITKEATWALATAFVLATDWTAGWVVLPGLVAYVLLRMALKPAQPDQPWLQHALLSVQQRKQQERMWTSYLRSIGGLRATPWVVAGSIGTLPVTGWVFLVAWLQTFLAMDHGRILAGGFLFVVPVAASVAPSWLLPLWALASVYWPFQSDYGV